MIRQSHNSTWPLLCILACLFILSAIAPRSWEHVARYQSADEYMRGSATRLNSTVVETETPDLTLGWQVAEVAGPIAGRSPADIVPALLSVTNTEVMDAAPVESEEVEPAWAIDPAVIERDDESWLVPAHEVAVDIGPQVDAKEGALDEELMAALDAELTDVSSANEDRSVEMVWPREENPSTIPVALVAVAGPALTRHAESVKEKSEPAPPYRWTEPQALSARVEGLVFECSTGAWAIEVRSQVRKLGRAMAHLSERTPALLDSLERLAAETEPLASSVDDQLAREVRRAGFALERRLALWKMSLVACDASERADLLECVERFEQTGLASDGLAVAKTIHRLSESSVEERRALGRRIEETYGNANFRVNICQSLLNRFIPAPAAEYGEVNDTILGRPVRGNSLTSTGITVEFVPDPNHLRMAFRVAGEVASLTSATAGPVRFVNGSEAMYFARKDLEIRADGVLLSPAAVSVQNRMQLRSVETDLDWIPLIGMIAQNVARSQHEAAQPAASREVEQKITQQARTRIDNEVYAKLNTAVTKLRDRVFVPMSRLSLEPATISAETNTERMVTRLRLAGQGQVGGYTPRPRDPADCLLSVQVHESAINNFLQRLDLDGRTLTLPQCARQVSEKLNLPEPWTTNPDHDDVTITFAPHNAIAVRCQEGQVVITLSIIRLSNTNSEWRDFQARVCYRPMVEGRAVRLVRDGVVQLLSPRMGNRGQLAVRGIFSTTFPKDRAFPVVPERFVQDERVQDLAVDQMVIEDGWFALALGPARLAEQPSERR